MTVALREGQIFVKKKHELADMAKQLDKVTPDAIELMATKMLDEENVPLKDRLKLAEALVDMKIRVTDQINKDEITRQIAEIKARGVSTPLVPGEQEKKPGPPRLEMNTIQKV